MRFATALLRASVRVAISQSEDAPFGAASSRARIMPLPLGMKDLLFVAITVGFFALSWIYVRAAERL